MTIETKLENNIMTIYVSGRVDSTNSSKLSAFYDSLADKTYTRIILDASNLEYISSSGLRVLLKIQKAERTRFEMVNVSRDVYDVLELTGFSEIIKISQTRRKISIEGCEIIGRGRTGAVYRIDEDTIIKLYYESVDDSAIEQEKVYAKAAFLRGIPTALSFDIVECDNRLGLIYELVNAETLAHKIMNDRENLQKYVEQYVKLAKQLHSTHVAGDAFQSVTDMYQRLVGKMGDLLTSEEKEACVRLIDCIPECDTLLHGDLHTKNIMVQDGELLLIDMADLSYGNPIFELAGNYLTFIIAGMVGPAKLEEGIGLDYEMARQVWDMFLRGYFATDNEQYLELLGKKIGYFAMLKMILASAITQSVSKNTAEKLIGLSRIKFFPFIDQITGKLDLTQN